jgi:hypothetical protein
MSFHGMTGKQNRNPSLGDERGNIILMALLGLGVVVLIGLGLPRLLQRREPGLDGAAPTADATQESKKKRTSIFGSSEEEEGATSEAKSTTHAESPDAEGEGAGEEVALAEENIEGMAAAPTAYGMDAEGYCTSVEEPGKSAGDIKLTQKVWTPVVEDFRAAKRRVVEWMKKHPDQFPAERFAVLSEKVLDLQIQRPPSEEEPDLAWRGMVVLSRFPDGKPLLRVGGGFLALHQKYPKRARFELARAVSLLLSPCEMKKMEFADTWEKVASCSQGGGSETCEVGSVSNQAWMFASAIAQEAQPPGCKILAVEKSGFLGCLSKKALKREVASVPAAASPQGAHETASHDTHENGGHHE